MSKLKIYKASAGSGKTHTLTEEYLRLASLFPDNFKRILAVTFTNKAAEEMKIRILESLNDIINKGKEAPFYYIFFENDKKANEVNHVERAKELRDSILHDYSYFSLGTIDSFVQKVIRSFTYEIGIESGYRVELDTEKVLNELTELLYKQIDIDNSLRTWLIHFANFKMDDGKNWDFRGEIYKLAKEIFKEQFQSFGDDDGNENDFAYILDYFNLLNSVKQNFEKAMAKLGEEALAQISKLKIDFSLLGRNANSIVKYFTIHLIDPENQDSFIPSATTQKMCGYQDSWYVQKAKPEVITEALKLYEFINPLLEEALRILKNDYRFYLSAINILSAFHAFGILRKIADLLPAYRANNNLLLISDTTRILKEIVSGNDAPFIYEKIGNRYRHILIDEFQDTSGFQWENFKPLIKNGLSEGNENLIVGDIKQSIYRWRGGDWNILMSKVDEDIGISYIKHANLETNRRSKKNILDFNNALFTDVSSLAQGLFDNELNEVIGSGELNTAENHFKSVISEAYADVCQKLPGDSKKAGGRVKVQFFKLAKGDKKEDWHKLVAEELPNQIEILLTQKNYQPGDIAILVRRNEEGKEVANLLLDYQQSKPDSVRYQIISSESLLLISSPVVQVLINAMYCLHDAKDIIHLRALIVSNFVIKKPDQEIGFEHFDRLDSKISRELLIDEFFTQSEHLKKLNVYDLCEKLVNIFKLNVYEGQLAYLQSFQDVILEFGQNESVDLATFLNWWEEKGKTFAVQLSDQQDAIKILSIHKSKGLAFKIVIIPYCDWELKPNSFLNNIIWTSTDIEPFNKFKRFPIVYRGYLKNSIFWKEYYEELLYTMIDALNMLYVAFTRPKEELIILAPAKEIKDKKYVSVADLLYDAISNSTGMPGLINLRENYFPQVCIYELKKDYNDFDGEKFLKQPVSESSFSIKEFSGGDWNSKISIMHNADDFFIKSIEYIQMQVDYGRLMHAIFSRIDHPKNIDQVVDEFYYAGKINSGERKTLLYKVKEMINRAEVKEWFSDKWEVKTEDAILDTTGKIRIPDRVLIDENETLIIDFKFGEVYEDSVSQVKEYMELLSKMDYPNVKGFIYYAEKSLVQEVSLS